VSVAVSVRQDGFLGMLRKYGVDPGQARMQDALVFPAVANNTCEFGDGAHDRYPESRGKRGVYSSPEGRPSCWQEASMGGSGGDKCALERDRGTRNATEDSETDIKPCTSSSRIEMSSAS
jgi:hypothetical protein